MSYGIELPDQVDSLNNVIEKQLSLLSDVRDLIKERAVLEKDYAQKLQVIARKAAEKRARTAASRVVGDYAVKAHNDDLLKRNTLESAYTMLIESYDASAQDHQNFGESLNTQISLDLKMLEQKKEELRRKEMVAFQKALSDRDRIYGDRIKAKQKYDEECLEFDGYRQKQERAVDDKHADRAAKLYDSQKVEMMNSKNTYITTIAVANKVKHKFYAEDLPALENQFQHIQTSLTTSLHKILRHSHQLQLQLISSVQYKLSLFDGALNAFDPVKDQELFIEYNRRIGPSAFSEPGDFVWEPCPGYYDAGEMNVETEPKVFLQNKLVRSQTKLEETQSLVKTKMREVEKLFQVVVAYEKDEKLGDANEAMTNLLDAQHGLIQLTTIETALQGEIDTMVGVLGDDQGAGQPHTFKSSSFSIPTPSVHSKCELKVPAECSGASGTKKSPVRARPTVTAGSTSSRLSVVTNDQVAEDVIIETSAPLATTPTASALGFPSSAGSNDGPEVTILFDFVASSPYELSVKVGDVVNVLEEDDGTGWVKVKNKRQEKGLVPAAYISAVGGGGGSSIAIAGPAKQKKQGSVRGLYDYAAGGDDELSISAGKMIELTAVGESYAEGWSEGIDKSGKKGIFPSNYVEPV
ncbi:hypothetical protein FRB98_003726 [Tulasnella sp. 332]|nr:hypothetical protein FRB98_003726 [Tulasnella sp. 332]